MPALLPPTATISVDTTSPAASLTPPPSSPTSEPDIFRLALSDDDILPDKPATGDVDHSVRKPKQKHQQKTKKKNELPDVIIPPCGDPWPRPYYFEDGLRKLRPYFYTYNTYCKERWRGRGLLEIFAAEFRAKTPDYYRGCIESGAITVNSQLVSPDYIVQNGDCVTHTLHRHEPPVTGDPIQTLHEDENMLVVVKPAGVPVHPAGRYCFNSVVEILKSERPGFQPLPCHRLDRLTSGIMFFAKTPAAATRLTNQITQRTVRKEYIARVIGEFPDTDMVCDQPILQISPKLGLNRVRANGKPARTIFKRLAYYPDKSASQSGGDGEKKPSFDPAKPWVGKKGYSIVRCLPVTGRTHQIRVHLQFLGYPIQNDPIYANQSVWGFNLGKDDADGSEQSDEDVITRLNRMGKDEVANAVAYYDEMVDRHHKSKAERLSGESCELCNTELYTDPGLHELELWLHSLRYQDMGGAWGYVTPLPAWALPPEGEDGPTEVGPVDDLVEVLGRQSIRNI